MSATVQHHPLQLDTAYGVCGHIARAHAKNFYYGFALLPRRKRNALSAVYAFMRHADDITDNAALSVEERRARLSDFLACYHRVADGAICPGHPSSAARHLAAALSLGRAGGICLFSQAAGPGPS